ncbi:MAG: nuclear transport factor 2 family protein [Gemmatimonadetes bacterium]|nr:nuclear transport factor 2 family protein [Gemmatimonadota bacterium]
MAAPLAGQQPPATASAAVDAFHRALQQGDSATALSLLAPDVVVFESGTRQLSREEYRSHHLGADMAFEGATATEVVARRAGEAGEVAWVLSETRTMGTFRGREVDRSGVETMLLRRTADGWRIVHVHWSARR